LLPTHPSATRRRFPPRTYRLHAPPATAEGSPFSLSDPIPESGLPDHSPHTPERVRFPIRSIHIAYFRHLTMDYVTQHFVNSTNWHPAATAAWHSLSAR